MPAMIVSPVSSSVWHWKVGSSFDSTARVWDSLSRSPLLWGSMDMEITVSGNSSDSSVTWWPRAVMVSPVWVFLSPTAATMSPAWQASMGSREAACMRYSRPRRSFLPVRELITWVPASILPE